MSERAKASDENQSGLTDLLSVSPFEFKVVDDHIVRFKRENGEEYGKIHKDDVEKICLFISDLDHDLWMIRRSRSDLEKKHKEMVDAVSAAIDR